MKHKNISTTVTLPCEIGDSVYVIGKQYGFTHWVYKIKEYKVKCFLINENKCIGIKCERNYALDTVCFNPDADNLFYDYEECEQALKQLSKVNMT